MSRRAAECAQLHARHGQRRSDDRPWTRGRKTMAEQQATGRLAGKVAIVTGGTSGIGRRMVERFTQEGATVIFSGRREEEGARVASATGASFVQADVTREVDAQRTVASALDRH